MLALISTTSLSLQDYFHLFSFFFCTHLYKNEYVKLYVTVIFLCMNYIFTCSTSTSVLFMNHFSIPSQLQGNVGRMEWNK